LDNLPVGTIKDIEHISGSGGITIVLEDGTRLFGDNGPVVRAFEDMFGNVIRQDHTFNKDMVIGKQIEYLVDTIGILEGMNTV